MYIKYVEPLKNHTDVVIKENGIDIPEINILNDKINSILDINHE